MTTIKTETIRFKFEDITRENGAFIADKTDELLETFGGTTTVTTPYIFFTYHIPYDLFSLLRECEIADVDSKDIIGVDMVARKVLLVDGSITSVREELLKKELDLFEWFPGDMIVVGKPKTMRRYKINDDDYMIVGYSGDEMMKCGLNEVEEYFIGAERVIEKDYKFRMIRTKSHRDPNLSDLDTGFIIEAEITDYLTKDIIGYDAANNAVLLIDGSITKAKVVPACKFASNYLVVEATK